MNGLEQMLSQAWELLSNPFTQRLGWTLLHFLWQGVVLALLLWASMLLLPRRKANVRYAATCLALLLVAITPVGTFFLVSPPSGFRATERLDAPARETERAVAAPIAASAPRPEYAIPSPDRVNVDPVEEAIEAPLVALKKERTRRPEEVSLAARVDQMLRRVGRQVNHILPWLVVGWLTGVVILSLRLLGGWTQLHRLRRDSIVPATTQCQALLKKLVRRMRISRSVRLVESGLVRVPVVLGFLRPMILLPASAVTGLTPRQLEGILAHELAHIRRHDYLVNLLQTALETLLFYHPAVWWVSKRMRVERENCCDDAAAEACGDTIAYARALADLEELRDGGTWAAVAASGGSLLARIRRLTVSPPPRSAARPRWLAGIVVIFVLLGVGLGAQFLGDSPADDPPTTATQTRYEGRTIADWIAEWDSSYLKRVEAASVALQRIGRPAVPALIEALNSGNPRASYARNVLRKMGPEAEEAVPWLIVTAMGRNTDSKAHEYARWNAIYVLGGLTWAAERAMPVIQRIAEDPGESDLHRSIAISVLQEMGRRTMPILRKLADSEKGEIRDHARAAIAGLLAEGGPEAAKEYYTQLIEEDPFDPSVPKYLIRTKTGAINNGWRGLSHPLSEKIKALYRRRLREKPDPELAWRLAEIIEVGMAGTHLQWAAPTDSSSSHWGREDPGESFVTMVPVLEHGLRYAQKNSERWRDFGVRLARLHLLRGDWEKVNVMLRALGEETVPAEARRWLPGPPKEWKKGFSADWGSADPLMISGRCSLEFRFEKGGKGLRGVHVLLRKRAKPERGFRSGIRVDTLFFDPSTTGFGYGGDDRAETRYAVSDASGVVRFDKLPKISIKIEVLVPTANFPERGRDWDFWLEDGPTVVELAEGKTVRYPRMVLFQEYALNVRDWDKVDGDSFELRWEGPDAAKIEGLRYELEMTLSAPAESTGIFSSAPVIQSARQIVAGNQWPVGEKGVGGMRLEPGNIYVFSVLATDDSGTPVFSWPGTRIWVPWDYRRTNPPIVTDEHVDLPPVYSGVWHNGNINYGKVEDEDFRQRIDRFLLENPDSFEADYNRLGKAWIEWDKGDPGKARKQFEKLIRELPRGNLARGTAVHLLARLDRGEDAPRNLEFVPDAPTKSAAKEVNFEVHRLIQLLNSKDPSDRVYAAFDLGERGKEAAPAIPGLINLLDDTKRKTRTREGPWTHPVVCVTVSDALVKIGEPAINPLIAVLGTRKGLNAGRSLRGIGAPAVPALIAAFRTDKDLVRQHAIEAFKWMKPPPVEPLIQALKDKDPRTRAAAASSLVHHRDKRAVEPLMALLTDGNPQARTSAVTTLGAIRDRRAIDALIRLLENDKEVSRAETASALHRITGTDLGEDPAKWRAWRAEQKRVFEVDVPPDVQREIDRLAAENPVERARAAAALGRMKEKARPAIPGLVELLGDHRQAFFEIDGKHTGTHVFAEASKALAEMGEPAIGPLVAAIGRRGAAQALGRMGEPAVGPLLAALRKGNAEARQGGEAFGAMGKNVVEILISRLHDENAVVRTALADGLGRIGDPRALAPLVGLLKDNNADVKKMAIGALAAIGGDIAVEALADLVPRVSNRQPSAMRSKVMKALGNISESSATEMLIRFAGDPDRETRVLAVLALRKHRDPSAVDAVLQALKDEDPEVRQAAADSMKSLGRVDGVDRVQPLLAVLQDENESPTVRVRAAQAIGETGREGIDVLIRLLRNEGPELRRLAIVGLARSHFNSGHLAEGIPLWRHLFAAGMSEAAGTRLRDEVNSPQAAKNHKDPRIRALADDAAIIANREHTIHPLTRFLILALEDENAEVRKAAKAALRTQPPIPYLSSTWKTWWTATDPRWGPAVHGVQCRLRGWKHRDWRQIRLRNGDIMRTVKDPPVLRLDLRNERSQTFSTVISPQDLSLEVDGRQYSHAARAVPAFAVEAGMQLNGLILPMDQRWRGLKLSPGKHLVRARIDGTGGGKEIELISNTVEVQVLPDGEQALAVGNFKFEAGFFPDKQEILLGEGLHVNFYVRNTADKPVTFDTSGDQSAHPDGIVISVTDADGQKLKDLSPEIRMGGPVTGVTLDAGKSYLLRCFLPRYFRIEKPGVYSVTCRRTLNLATSASSLPHGDEGRTEVSTVFSVKVLPATEERMRALIDQLGERVRDGDKPTISSAVFALSGLEDERVVPHLAAAVFRCPWLNKGAAIAGLSRYPTRQSIEALTFANKLDARAGKALAAMNKTDFAVDAFLEELKAENAAARILAIRGLGNSGSPRAFDPLKAALEDEEFKVRCAAAEAIGKLQDPRSPETLRILLQEMKPVPRPSESEYARIIDLGITTPDLRMSAVRGLVSAGVPIRGEWLAPVLRDITDINDRRFHELFEILRWKGADDAVIDVVKCLHFDDPSPKSSWNSWMLKYIKLLKGSPPNLDRFHYDANHEPLANQTEKNRKLLRQLKAWANKQSGGK